MRTTTLKYPISYIPVQWLWQLASRIFRRAAQHANPLNQRSLSNLLYDCGGGASDILVPHVISPTGCGVLDGCLIHLYGRNNLDNICDHNRLYSCKNTASKMWIYLQKILQTQCVVSMLSNIHIEEPIKEVKLWLDFCVAGFILRLKE